MMKKIIEKTIFSKFNREILTESERKILDEGVQKHAGVLKYCLLFLPFQIAIALLSTDLFTLLSAVSFISLLLGGAWYTMSFQNISAEQLKAGVADFITKKMFRSFIVSLNMLVIGIIFFLTKTIVPEALVFIPELIETPIIVRVIILLGNIVWMAVLAVDIYKSSAAYDAADSLLGDGFPTMMRGAQATQIIAQIVSEQQTES